VTHWLTAS